MPLPGVPTKVERGGEWTLQRLDREVNPAREAPWPRQAGIRRQRPGPREVLTTASTRSTSPCSEGGGKAVGDWAHEHGFRLSPDAPEVLDFYAERSPIFMAARFDGDAGPRRAASAIGDGTPIHLTIPTANPWVPLRILGLGQQPADADVDADVFLLTDRRPACCPGRSTPAPTGSPWSEPAPPPASSSPTSAPTRAWSGCRPPACGSATCGSTPPPAR